MNKTLQKILPVLTEEQAQKVERLVSGGADFHSLFRDGAVELFQDGKPMYVERNGEVMGS